MSVLSQLLMARSLMPVILGAKTLTSKMLLFHIGFYSRLRPPPVAAISLKRIIPLLAQSEVTRSHELADLFRGIYFRALNMPPSGSIAMYICVHEQIFQTWI